MPRDAPTVVQSSDFMFCLERSEYLLKRKVGTAWEVCVISSGKDRTKVLISLYETALHRKKHSLLIKNLISLFDPDDLLGRTENGHSVLGIALRDDYEKVESKPIRKEVVKYLLERQKELKLGPSFVGKALFESDVKNAGAYVYLSDKIEQLAKEKKEAGESQGSIEVEKKLESVRDIRRLFTKPAINNKLQKVSYNIGLLRKKIKYLDEHHEGFKQLLKSERMANQNIEIPKASKALYHFLDKVTELVHDFDVLSQSYMRGKFDTLVRELEGDETVLREINTHRESGIKSLLSKIIRLFTDVIRNRNAFFVPQTETSKLITELQKEIDEVIGSKPIEG